MVERFAATEFRETPKLEANFRMLSKTLKNEAKLNASDLFIADNRMDPSMWIED